MIIIDTKKLLHILDVTPATHNIMLVGRHGIGKSEILTDYYQRKGYRVVPLFLGQMSDPGDLIGLPTKTGERTDFLPPYWFPIDGKPIVLFLDELNRARPEILQTVMDLALNRRLAGHMLPEGSRIISAVNEGDEYQLTHLDPSLVSRFNVYQFCPTVQEWLLWAQLTHLDQRIIDFIQNEPTLLDGTPEQKEGEDTGLEKYPDRRAWKRISDIIQEMSPDGTLRPRRHLGEDDLDLIAGIVGAQAASRFFAFTQGNQMLSGVQVLNDCNACEAKLRSYRLHQLAIINESIFQHLEVAYPDSSQLLAFSLVAKDDSTSMDVVQLHRYADNLLRYYNLLENMEQKEAIAHLANLFESGSYPEAILFVTTFCPEIYQKLATFIANI
ncbi:MAG: AAA family ATPase [Bacteroidales bacterium]|nr:AAA family ATPase [Bacteroidales bacterium]